MAKEEKWVVVDVFENGMKAEIVRGFLEENGVLSRVRGSTTPYGGTAYFGQTGPKEVLVLEDDLEEAKRLLEEKNNM